MERTKTGEFNSIDISTRDFDVQSAFYEALFGWTRTDTPFGEGQTYRMFKKDGHAVAGMSQLPAEVAAAAGAPTAWNTYVATDDVDETASQAVELGADIAMPPMDVEGFGRMAAIQDPTGAFLFFWKPLRHDTTTAYGEPGTLAWNDLSTRDPEKAMAFYSALLGWEFSSREGGQGGAMPYWTIRVGDQLEGGVMPMPDMLPPEAPSFWMPYFGSADTKSDVAKAVGLGARVLVQPTIVAGTVTFAVLSDPLGATFGLMQPEGA